MQKWAPYLIPSRMVLPKFIEVQFSGLIDPKEETVVQTDNSTFHQFYPFFSVHRRLQWKQGWVDWVQEGDRLKSGGCQIRLPFPDPILWHGSMQVEHVTSRGPSRHHYAAEAYSLVREQMHPYLETSLTHLQ